MRNWIFSYLGVIIKTAVINILTHVFSELTCALLLGNIYRTGIARSKTIIRFALVVIAK